MGIEQTESIELTDYFLSTCPQYRRERIILTEATGDGFITIGKITTSPSFDCRVRGNIALGRGALSNIL